MNVNKNSKVLTVGSECQDASSGRRMLAWAAAGLVAAGLAVSPVLAGQADAAAGTTMDAVNVRSGPGTNAKVVDTIKKGVKVSYDCYQRSSAVTGPYGTSTAWLRLSGSKSRWISEAWVYTGTSAMVSPTCTSYDAPPTSTTKALKALSWANAQIGKTGWNGWCERFVENAWSVSGRYPSAIAHYNAVRGKVRTTGTPPKGAIVFYAAAPINSYYGHVMISRGDGTYVTTAARVQVVNQSWPGAKYLGWYLPNF